MKYLYEVKVKINILKDKKGSEDVGLNGYF